MLLEPQFRTKLSDKIWSNVERVARMASFEGALARAQSNVGLISQSSADAIASICGGKFAKPEAIFDEAIRAGNPAIPFISHLTEIVANKHREAAADVHFGSTSQDLIDTANMIALVQVAERLEEDLEQIVSDLHRLSVLYAETPMLARTLFQPATPITFGLKAAIWGLALKRNRKLVQTLQQTELAIQLGGSNGALPAMSPHGNVIRADMALQLGLANPDHCWHTLRDRILTIAATLAGTIGATAKIAGDCLLMMQAEVGELQEGQPGTSTSMPQKKNPVHALIPVAALPIAAAQISVITAAQLHPHERAPGQWHSEWISLPLLSTLALVSVERLKEMLRHLDVNSSRMRLNVGNTNGSLGSEELVQSLRGILGRSKAHSLVKTLSYQTDEKTFAERILCDQTLRKLIPEKTLRNILDYKRPLAASVSEAQRLSSQLMDP